MKTREARALASAVLRAHLKHALGVVGHQVGGLAHSTASMHAQPQALGMQRRHQGHAHFHTGPFHAEKLVVDGEDLT